jgi:SPP1 family predicted phage head-tail adaptor
MMEAGHLRHRITIQQPTIGTPDAVGESVPTWGTFATAWADVATLQGRELAFARGIAATVTHKVTLRYLAGVTSAMRVLFGSAVLSIAAVLDSENRNRQLDLLCEAVA